jgi:two-component system, NtrC family, sensor kinase
MSNIADRQPRDPPSAGPGPRPVADYWKLSRQLSSHALPGDPLHIYLWRIAGEILSFQGCAQVEIWCKDARRPFRLVRAEGDGEEPTSVGPLPSVAETPLEDLCRTLLSEPPPGVTAEPVGQQQTGGALFAWHDEGGPSPSRCLVLPFASHPADPSNPWLVVLYPRPGHPFAEQEIPHLEEVMRSLSVALALRATHSSLRERMKELTCLYGIALLKEEPAMPVEEVLGGIVALLPPAWLHPGDAWACLALDSGTYHAGHAGEPRGDGLSAPVSIRGVVRGEITVGYAREHSSLDHGPFLLEEETLLETVAREIALVLERRQVAEENLGLEQQLQRSERLATVGETAAGITHELNEPLNNVLGFAQLLQANPDMPAEAQRDLSLIVSSALHARQVIRQLLLFSSRFYEAQTLVDLNALVGSTLSFLEVICAKAGIILAHDLADGLPGISASPDQLRQVLVNLVVNASQATPAGGSIAISTSAAEGEEESVRLTVEDSGPGMPEDVREKIFLPFFTTREGGTGMGLSVVHGIVATHGGRIAVRSAPGKGTRFEITFPVARG